MMFFIIFYLKLSIFFFYLRKQTPTYDTLPLLTSPKPQLTTKQRSSQTSCSVPSGTCQPPTTYSPSIGGPPALQRPWEEWACWGGSGSEGLLPCGTTPSLASQCVRLCAEPVGGGESLRINVS